MNYPKTKKENIVDIYGKISVPDPYRWLEDYNDSEVKNWVKLQNELTEIALKKEDFDIFSEELKRDFELSNFTNPLPVKGKYFYGERKVGENQHVLYMKEGLEGEPKILFDPNQINKDGTVSVDYWYVSRSGKYIVYGISKGGDEMATLHVRNTETGDDLSESIERCRHSSVAWLPDDSGFFYTRNPREGEVPKNEESLHIKLYIHKLGESPEQDEMVFGKDLSKDEMIRIGLSIDGKYLAIHVSKKWTENDVYIYDCDAKTAKPVVVGIPAHFSIVLMQDKVFLQTNYKANNYRILTSSLDDIYKSIDEWKELIPEQKSLLEIFAVTKDKILTEYLDNVCSKVQIFTHMGEKIGEIPLPPFSSLAGVSNRREESEFFYGVTSFTFPKITYRYDPNDENYKVYRKTDSSIDSEKYVVKQEWYASKDGTRVPIFIIHKKSLELNRKNPTILYGYGGFASNQTPEFLKGWIPWLERGGVYAVANIRGGAEFGEKWHKKGINEHKQNSFDDFISAGEHLIKNNYTSQENLGILGASNGGLLVSAVGIQRPDLFKAVCSKVPLTDMVRFPKFGMAMRWIHEYGNPENLEDLSKILKWSPYHNVKNDKEYPNFLFTTAEKDSRVDPLHARKMVAALQEVSKKNEVFLRTEIEAGHGPGKPIWKVVENQALILAFFARELGLKV